jgi:co-chaperonin GroES (HSP10)
MTEKKNNLPLKAVGYHLILLVLEEDKPEEKSNGGIIISTKQPKDIRISEIGVVLDIGSTAFSEIGGPEAAGVFSEDKVIFSKHAGVIRHINGQDYRIINDTDVLAVIKEDELC